MHHLILGYGYCGYYLARELLAHGNQVTAVSRHLSSELSLPGLKHISHDVTQPFFWNEANTIVYYLIPPPPHGEQDSFLKQCLRANQIKAKKMIYFGSSGVYGDHKGAWVNEHSYCIPGIARQLRRLDAEQQWLTYCQQHSIQPILLRIAGIYGPQRIPVEAAKGQIPVIEKTNAPYTNHIYVKDLVKIAYWLGQSSPAEHLYNIADGNPQPMGTMQQLVAQLSGYKEASYANWQEVWDKASPMKREFMLNSKRLSIDRLKQCMGPHLSLTSLNDAILESMALELDNR